MHSPLKSLPMMFSCYDCLSKIRNSFFLACQLLGITAYAQPTSNIQLNQLGFYTHGPKIAVINAAISSTKFYLLSANKKDTVYRGNLTDSVHPEYSAIATHI